MVTVQVAPTPKTPRPPWREKPPIHADERRFGGEAFVRSNVRVFGRSSGPGKVRTSEPPNLRTPCLSISASIGGCDSGALIGADERRSRSTALLGWISWRITRPQVLR